MHADLLIANGRLFDPGSNLDRPGNLALGDGKIAAVGDTAGVEAMETLDASGCLVMPGLVDFHAHIFHNGTDSGLPPDLATLPGGVTGVVDQGSSGAVNYRMLLHLLSTCTVTARIVLHVTPMGQATGQHPEFLKPTAWNQRQIRTAFDRDGDSILGLKVRISRHVVLEQGMEPFRAAVRLAREIGTRLVVHVTDPPAPMAEVADLLGPGDVLCHMYHGTGHTILDDCRVGQAVLAARERGVLFDSAHGSANFSFPVAEAALAQGFLPDVIGTDLTARTWLRQPLVDLPHLMSKFLHLGMSLADVVRRVTANPAGLMGLEGRIGCLRAGADADVTIMREQAANPVFRDSHGRTRQGSSLLVPMATLSRGLLRYRNPAMPLPTRNQ